MKKINFTAMKVLFVKTDTNIENMLVSNKICSAENNYKCFIGYLCDHYKVKPLHIMLSKTSPYVKSYAEKTKCIF